MAVVQYKCDTCKREVEVPRDPETLEVVGRCIITEGCRGYLYQLDIKQDYDRPKRTAPVRGLTDWIQRKKLYTHEQNVSSSQWIVDHNLGVLPSVQVIIEREVSGKQNQFLEVQPEQIETVSLNRIIVHLSRAESGIAQCIARSTVQPGERAEEEPPEDTEPVQLSNSNYISIATKSDQDVIYIKMHFADSDDVFREYVYEVNKGTALFSPWNDVSSIYANNKRYTIRNINYKSPLFGSNDFLDGTITNGSAAYISAVNYNNAQSDDWETLEKEQMLLLLAQRPYNNQDKLLDQVVYPTDITRQNASNMMYVDSDEIHIADKAVKDLFPYIKIIN